MRIIKFRCWNSKIKQMQEWEEIKTMNANILFQGNEEVPIMQFTGLSDRNGKEIYEGDIVKAYFKDGSLITEAYVVFREDTASYHISTGSILCAFSKNFIEIIGNIYENPELINTLDK